MRRLLLAVVALVAVGAGQHWEFEQVDTAVWGRQWIELEFGPDGRCFVAYGDQEQLVARVASRDSVWRYQDVAIPNRGYYGGTFAVSRTGKYGVAYADTTLHATLLEWRDTAWVSRTSDYEVVFGRVPFAYDSSGDAMLLCNTSLGDYGVVRLTLGDTWEAVDTVMWSSSPYFDYGPVDIAVGPDDGVWALVQGGYSFPGFGRGADPPWSSELYLMHPGPDSWEREWLAGGTEVGITATALAARHGSAATCQCETGGLWPEHISRFRCSPDSLDTLAWAAGLAVDDMGRVCLAYTRPDELCFMYRDSLGWHRRLISTAIDRETRVDVEMGPLGQPVVAFSTTDGIWIARGVDVLGTEEQGAEPPVHARWPTIMRAPDLARLACRVVDALGRDVTDRRHRLAPGVYFLNEHTASSSEHSGRTGVRKVVVQD
ncbi:hypothetical protein JXB37_04085 [candidate division WOR-3 bacterium]|nr:hypothetical protein [candidate division WOR-3 bacterium]